MNHQIILASASPRRKELLRKLGLKFKIVKSNFKEDLDLPLSPKRLVELLSYGKAAAVAKHFSTHTVIAADTVVVYQNKVLGKPHTPKEAVRMLKMLSGKHHSVFTGITVMNKSLGKKISLAVKSKVAFRDLSRGEITKYVKTGEPLDKAGAYAIQAGAAVFISKITGDYTNIIGLPIPALLQILKKFGIGI